MLSSTTAILALAIAAQVQAAPLQGAVASGAAVHSVEAIHNTNHVRNGTAAMLKAYRKWGLTPTREFPESFRSELSKRQDSSAPASPDSNDVEYLVPTTVGGQTLNLDFDTGSADLWVFSSLLAASSKAGHDIYTSTSSPTYSALTGSKWSIQYADGSGASGVAGTDTVTIGGTTVTKQVIELANKVSSAFVTDESDGLVGLAFSTINTVTPTKAKTFFDNAKASLLSPLFAAYLPFRANGAYDFGAVNTARYSGTLAYATVSSAGGFWEFPSTSYKVGTTTHAMSGLTGIADTGTTLLLTTDGPVDTYYASVSGAAYDSSQGGYTFPCTAVLPSFSVRIGTTTYATIPGSLLNFAPIDSTGRTCFGSLQSVGGGTQNIYGDTFFNAYYGVFDASTPRFGFAPLV